MRSLEQFWHWVENERPEYPWAMSHNLSDVAGEALDTALMLVARRAGEQRSSMSVLICNRTEAVRDLSLALCAALEAMREVVRESPLVSLMNERNRIVVEIDKAEAETPKAWHIGPEQWAALPEMFAQSIANQMHRDAERERMAEQYTTMALPDALTQQLACQARADARRAEAIRLVEMGALSVERFNQIMESLDTTPQ